MDEKFKLERCSFTHNGRTIYEWEQTLDDVHLYITPPSGVSAKMIDCKITASKLALGLKGSPPYLENDFFANVKSKDSFWTFEDGVVHLTLQKMIKAETWTSAFKGHEGLDPHSTETTKQQLMLQRFQEENPGFDFSGAQFNGMAPDPKSFMGGINTATQ